MCRIQENLKSDLKKFGLNPVEWTIRELNQRKFKISNIKDHQFYFVGEARLVGSFLRWTNLQLISL